MTSSAPASRNRCVPRPRLCSRRRGSGRQPWPAWHGSRGSSAVLGGCASAASRAASFLRFLRCLATLGPGRSGDDPDVDGRRLVLAESRDGFVRVGRPGDGVAGRVKCGASEASPVVGDSRTRMVLAGKEPPYELRWGSVPGVASEHTSTVPNPQGPVLDYRLIPFPLRADRLRPTSTGHTHWKERLRACAVRTHARDPSGRPGRQEPGGHRPRHPPDHGRRRPDHQGRTVGTTAARLPDRPVPGRLVPHRPLRRPGRAADRARTQPAHHRGGHPPPDHAGRAPAKPRREDGDADAAGRDVDAAGLPSDLYEDEDDGAERIGEDESEAAPAAID